MFYVLTGGPCCGKTTQIKRLAELGYWTLPESSAQLIQEGESHPLKCLREFQLALWQRQAAQEAVAAARSSELNEPVFLDRSLLDGIAYMRTCGHEVPDFMHQVSTRHYRAAFILSTLETWVDDGIRFESAEFSRSIASQIAIVYQEKNVQTYFVPALPIAEVTQFILALI